MIKNRGKYKYLLKWGVTDQKEIERVRIENQIVDEIIEYNDKDKIYYIWFLFDAKVRKADDKIEIKVIK